MGAVRPQGRQIAAAVCLMAAVVLGIAGRVLLKEESRHPVSAASWESVTINEVRQIREQEAAREEPIDFTAWREEKEVWVTSADGFCGAQVVLLRLCGSSEYLFAGEKILSGDDAEGCLIGETVAEQLFGSRNAEGLFVVCGGRELVVRGVLKEPGQVVVLEEPDRDAVFDRITFAYGSGESSCDAFLNRYGLGGMQILDAGVSIRKLIPGKWSDFSGWRNNFAAEAGRHRKQREIQKSVLELRAELRREQGRLLLAAGAALLLAGMRLGSAGIRAKKRA